MARTRGAWASPSSSTLPHAARARQSRRERERGRGRGRGLGPGALPPIVARRDTRSGGRDPPPHHSDPRSSDPSPRLSDPGPSDPPPRRSGSTFSDPPPRPSDPRPSDPPPHRSDPRSSDPPPRPSDPGPSDPPSRCSDPRSSDPPPHRSDPGPSDPPPHRSSPDSVPEISVIPRRPRQSHRASSSTEVPSDMLEMVREGIGPLFDGAEGERRDFSAEELERLIAGTIERVQASQPTSSSHGRLCLLRHPDLHLTISHLTTEEKYRLFTDIRSRFTRGEELSEKELRDTIRQHFRDRKYNRLRKLKAMLRALDYDTDPDASLQKPAWIRRHLGLLCSRMRSSAFGMRRWIVRSLLLFTLARMRLPAGGRCIQCLIWRRGE
ncbi:hypothetical protein R1sor_008498 [Riccia sorocarpa]|uniref:Uncharacterized protein n=1 Tax=Riccia sorocarpa TaxID=122646 RepID=A0ABD3HTM3_9MARC